MEFTEKPAAVAPSAPAAPPMPMMSALPQLPRAGGVQPIRGAFGMMMGGPPVPGIGAAMPMMNPMMGRMMPFQAMRNMMLGNMRPGGLMGMRPGGLIAVQPKVPDKPETEEETVTAVLDKKHDGGRHHYLVEWKPDDKEDSWIDSITAIRKKSARTHLQVFEKELLEKVKSALKTEVNKLGRMEVQEVGKYLQANWPEFQMSYHRIHGVGMLVRQILGDGLSMEERGRGGRGYGRNAAVVTEKEKGKLREEKLKANVMLKSMWLDAINILKSQGGRSSCSEITFRLKRKYPNFNARDYGYGGKQGSMRKFLNDCPGIKVDPNPERAPVRVELENTSDPVPDCLKDFAKEQGNAAEERRSEAENRRRELRSERDRRDSRGSRRYSPPSRRRRDRSRSRGRYRPKRRRSSSRSASRSRSRGRRRSGRY